jgi:hypothetical protein
VTVTKEEILALLGPALVVRLGRCAALVVRDGRSGLLGLVLGDLGLVSLEHVAGTAAADVLSTVAGPASYSAMLLVDMSYDVASGNEVETYGSTS